MIEIVMARVLAAIVAWFAGWLVQRVPTLDPSQAGEVARVIVDNVWSLLLTSLTVGWVWLRRPFDKKVALPSGAVIIQYPDPRGPSAPADGERK